MSLACRCVYRPVAVAMLFVAVAVVGLVSALRLPIDLLPDVAYPRLIVYTPWPGVGPLEVQRMVSEPIERAVARVPGVERLQSVSREGVSLVTLGFAWGTDMDFAALGIREQLDNRSDALPELAGRPVVLRTDPTAEPIMSISVAGRELWALRDLAEALLKRRLEQIDGVAQAAVTGGPEREIQVDVDAQALEAYGLAITDVADALAGANVSAPGGTIRRGRYRYALRTLGELEGVEQIGEVVVASAPRLPGVIRIRDVAIVTDGWKDRDAIARYDGAEAVGLLLYKEAGANTVRVAEQVEEVLAQLREEYPEVRLDVAASQAGFISDSIANVVQALLIGGALAFLVLFLFLKDPRYPVVVVLAIPISVVATFALMDAFNVSLNIMSLGGLALGTGMLVDNSIIVLENVSRHREKATPGEGVVGRGAAVSAVVATEEVQSAVIASTLTTIAVFGPIVYVEGVAGELFGDLSLAVAMSLLVSLLVALTLLPTIAARWSDRAVSLPLLEWVDRGFRRLAERYDRALLWSLEHPRRVLGGNLAALALALLIASTLPRSVLPDVDQGSFRVRFELPLGTPIERTSRVAAAFEQRLLADDDVDAIFTHVGRRQTLGLVDELRSGSSTASLDVRLHGGASTDDVIDRVAAGMRRAVGDGSLIFESGGAGALGGFLGGREAAVTLRVRGDGFDRSLAYAQTLRAALEAAPELSDVRLGVELGQPEVRVRVDRDAIARYGLDVSAVAAAVETSMHGRVATHFVDFGRRVPVTVRLPDEERRSLATLDRVRVAGVPLRELVRTEATVGPSELRRSGQAGVVPVLADVREGGLSGALEAVAEVVERIPPPAGLRVDVGGENEEMRRSFRNLAFAFGLALLLVYMIIAAQLESLVQPVVIMVAVPLALIGAVLALWLTRAGLNTISLIGIVILIGIVVNDAIVKVDFINRARARGAVLRTAILDAGRARLRPILMTSVTTIVGLLPLALGVGSGAALRAPMAIAVIGGLMTSTAFTLLVVPVIYERVERLRVRPTEAASGP
ncbi:MAG TPA: efflux RND transporter permease subunit [Longimicrobiales bacterium]|nr:efflux RND transporter permease subunit [Longimicrobiales bacterium]